MGAELVTAVSGEVSGRDIEHGLGAGHALVVHAERRSRAREQDGAGTEEIGEALPEIIDVMKSAGKIADDADFIAALKESGPFTYTGSAIKPEVTVTYKKKPLVKGTDYEIS